MIFCSPTSPTMDVKKYDSAATATTGGAPADNFNPSSSSSFPQVIYKPTPYDVLLGRGRPFQSHPGNRRLHTVVDMYKQRYSNAKRHEKTEMAEEIVMFIKTTGKEKVGHCGRFLRRVTLEEVRQQHGAVAAAAAGGGSEDGGGGDTLMNSHLEFLKDTSASTSVGGGGWVEVSDLIARDKVSHALRGKVQEDALDGQKRRPQNHSSGSSSDDERKSGGVSTSGKVSSVKKSSGKTTGKDGNVARPAKSQIIAKTNDAKKSNIGPPVKNSKAGSQQSYRSHTEAIVEDMLSRKRDVAEDDKQKGKTMSVEPQPKKLKASSRTGHVSPSLPTSQNHQTNSSLQQQLMSLRQQQAADATNRPGIQQLPMSPQSVPSSNSIFYLQELRLRNALLEQELLLARLRGASGMPSSGLDATSLAVSRLLGTNLTGNSQSAPFNNLLPPAPAAPPSTAHTAPPSIATTFAGSNGTGSFFGNVGSLLPTSQLTGFSPFLNASISNAQMTASNQLLSSLRGDELLFLLSRSSNNNNSNNNAPGSNPPS